MDGKSLKEQRIHIHSFIHQAKVCENPTSTVLSGGERKQIPAVLKMESGGLLSRTTQTVSEGVGGSYYAWTSAEFPILSEAKLGGGVLILQLLGLALPHYADSSKIAYVTQGGGIAGILLPGATEEKVFKLNKGDMVPVPLGAISWWFNDENTELKVVFLGETSKAVSPGNVTYFFLSGTMGILNGFSNGIVMNALGLSEEEANEIVKSQLGAIIIKIKEDQPIPKPSTRGIVYNTEAAKTNINVENGGRLVLVTCDQLSLLKEVEMSGAIVKLHGNATYAPEYSSDSAFQVNYIIKGSGQVQVVGINGQNVLDEIVKAGDLFIVPRFFVVSVVAGEEEMEIFTLFTVQKPVLGELGGKISVLKGLSPEIVQTAFNITPELERSLRSKKNDIFTAGPTK